MLLSNYALGQLNFYFKSKYLQYKSLYRIKNYKYSIYIVYEKLLLIFFLQNIYFFISNTNRYYKYLSIIDIC